MIILRCPVLGHLVKVAVDKATSAAGFTYTYARRVVLQSVAGNGVFSAALLISVGAIAGASGSRLVQYGVLGAATGIGLQLVGVHSLAQGALRPVRVALVGDTGIGESLPRSRPTFAAWSNLSVVAVAFIVRRCGRDVGGRF